MTRRSPTTEKPARKSTSAKALQDARQQVKAGKLQVKLLKSQLKLARAALKAAKEAKKKAALAVMAAPKASAPAATRAKVSRPVKKKVVARASKPRPAAMSAMPVAPITIDTPPLVEPAKS